MKEYLNYLRQQKSFVGMYFYYFNLINFIIFLNMIVNYINIDFFNFIYLNFNFIYLNFKFIILRKVNFFFIIILNLTIRYDLLGFILLI